MSTRGWRHRLATVGSEKFAEWGYPTWFRFLVGSIEGICAVLLVIPRRRWRFLGGAALVLLLVGANTTHIVSGLELSERLAALTMLAIPAVIALTNWPADWRDLLRPRQPDVRATVEPAAPG